MLARNARLWLPQLVAPPGRAATGNAALAGRCAQGKRGPSMVQTRGMAGEWRRKKDHYAKAAQEYGIRSRAAYKLIQMNEKSKILEPGFSVVELGAAPGGWTIVAADLVKSDKKVHWSIEIEDQPVARAPQRQEEPGANALELEGQQGARRGKRPKVGRVVCCDLLEMDPVEGATFVRGDFLQDAVRRAVQSQLDGRHADVVLSDMAPNTTGKSDIDHYRIIDLCEAALHFSQKVLRPGGKLLVKLFNGSETNELKKNMQESGFKSVKILKPDASRNESSEIYFLASGYSGVPKS